MANDYFTHSSPLTRHTLGRAEQVNQIFEAVQAGFDKLADPEALREGRHNYVEDTGAADAYVVALPTAPSAYTAGLSFVMKATNANTGASTIDVNSLGVKSIKRYNGDDLSANDIVAGMLVHVAYDGTNFRIVGLHGGEVALAKNWAQGTGSGAPTEGSAKEWATETGVVDGGLKGARGYANDASSSASAASTSESNAATSESNAKAHFDTFRGVFYGAFASDPATDPNGDPPDEGDWYFNTTKNGSRQFDGSTWADIGTATLTTFVFTAAGGETSISGNDDDGNALAYTVGFVQVFLNGALLIGGDDYTASDGSTITGLSALTTGDKVVVHAFSQFQVSDPNTYEVTATGSSTARTLADRFADVINVQDFGAIGGDAVEDPAAFQAAIDTGAKEIYVPKSASAYSVDLESLTYPAGQAIRWLFQEGASTTSHQAPQAYVFPGGGSATDDNISVALGDGEQTDIYRVVGENNGNGAGSLYAYHFELTAGPDTSGSDPVRGLIGRVFNEGTGEVKAIRAGATDNNTVDGATSLMAISLDVTPNAQTSAAYIIQGNNAAASGVNDIVNAAVFTSSNGARWKSGIVFAQGDEFNDAVFQASMDSGSAATARFLKLKDAASNIIFEVQKDGTLRSSTGLHGGASITNSVKISTSKVQRTAAAGNLSIEAGSNAGTQIDFHTGGASRMQLVGENLGLGGGNFGSGQKVFFMANATAPGSNPTGGGIVYVESGALKFRGSSGTVTTLASA